MKIYQRLCVGLILFVFALVIAVPTFAATYCLTDTYGYKWKLTDGGSNANGRFFDGTMIFGAETRTAAASYLNSTNTVSMLGDKGTTSGVTFVYNIKWTGTGGTGIWKNTSSGSSSFGNVTVTLVTCTWSFDQPEPSAPILGPAPGVE